METHCKFTLISMSSPGWILSRVIFRTKPLFASTKMLLMAKYPTQNFHIFNSLKVYKSYKKSHLVYVFIDFAFLTLTVNMYTDIRINKYEHKLCYIMHILKGLGQSRIFNDYFLENFWNFSWNFFEKGRKNFGKICNK